MWKGPTPCAWPTCSWAPRKTTSTGKASGIEGCSRFLHRLWRLARHEARGGTDADLVERPANDDDRAVTRAAHQLVARVTDEYERWSYNTAVAAYMEFVNLLYKYVQAPDGARALTLDEAVDQLLLLMAPMAPHVTAELWEQRHGDHIHTHAWPVADAALLVEDTVTMVVQVKGKVRDRIEVSPDIAADAAEALALASERVQAHLDGPPGKVIVRPPSLVNIVP